MDGYAKLFECITGPNGGRIERAEPGRSDGAVLGSNVAGVTTRRVTRRRRDRRDYARVGDAAFDLACIAVASLALDADPGVRKRLFAHGIEVLDSRRRGAYIGNLLLRNLDWPIRKNRPSEVEFWLKQSERLLADVAPGP